MLKDKERRKRRWGGRMVAKDFWGPDKRPRRQSPRHSRPAAHEESGCDEVRQADERSTRAGRVMEKFSGGQRLSQENARIPPKVRAKCWRSFGALYTPTWRSKSRRRMTKSRHNVSRLREAKRGLISF